VTKLCSECGGLGEIPEVIPCPYCKGRGLIPGKPPVPCPNVGKCDWGKVETGKLVICLVCKGTGEEP
jgi:DNA-directed RNA polymerase subunit RPC12/RpoP